MFYINSLFENRNKNRDKFENIYDYIDDPKLKVKKPKIIYKNDFNYHEEKNVILLIYFYEILIRIAFAKFNDDTKTIESKVKIFFDNLKNILKVNKIREVIYQQL